MCVFFSCAQTKSIPVDTCIKEFHADIFTGHLIEYLLLQIEKWMLKPSLITGFFLFCVGAFGGEIGRQCWKVRASSEERVIKTSKR